MTSVPVRNSGVGSAINNAISRVGPQLAGALIFVFLTANFYAALASHLPGVDVSSSSFRNQVSPLNTPPDPNLVGVVRDASTSSFHLAMLVGAGLLLVGALVNAIGIRKAESLKRQEAAKSEPVTVTVPFDGASPRLYKTNAQNQWEQVASTVTGETVTGIRVMKRAAEGLRKVALELVTSVAGSGDHGGLKQFRQLDCGDTHP